MNAAEHFEAGRLQEAIAAQKRGRSATTGRSEPARLPGRVALFRGRPDCADRQLDAIVQLNPQLAVGISLFRQLVRAEQARDQFYSAGRLPEFLDGPTAVLRLHLEASIWLREGKPAEAVRLLAEAEEQRVKVAGVCHRPAVPARAIWTI